MRTCIFDLETMGFDADFDRLLCGVIKGYHDDCFELVVKPKKYNDDVDALIKIRDTLEKFDILVTFYGKAFDIPWLNSRLLLIGERRLKKMFHIDLYYVFKNKSKRSIRKKNLAHVADILGVEEGKMLIKNSIWRAAHDGDEKALQKIIERCRSDVRLTEQVYDKMKNCGWIDMLRKE